MLTEHRVFVLRHLPVRIDLALSFWMSGPLAIVASTKLIETSQALELERRLKLLIRETCKLSGGNTKTRNV